MLVIFKKMLRSTLSTSGTVHKVVSLAFLFFLLFLVFPFEKLHPFKLIVEMGIISVNNCFSLSVPVLATKN